MGGTTSTTTKKSTKVKKKETKATSSSSNLTEELKELNKLYKEGVLTKEEFEEASDEYGSDKISTIVIPPEEEWVTINSIVS